MNQAIVTTERSQTFQIKFLPRHTKSGVFEFCGQQFQVVLINSSLGSSIKLMKLSDEKIALDLGFEISYSMGQLQHKCIIDFGLGAQETQLFSVCGGVGDALSMKIHMKSIESMSPELSLKDNLSSVTEAIGQMKVESTESDRQSVPECPEFKLLLLGGAEATVDFMSGFHLSCEKKYVASLGVEVRPLAFYTNRGPIKFNVWTHTDQENGLRDGYYNLGQCAILLFDVTSRITYMNIPIWHRDITRTCGGIPMVVAGHKASKESVSKVKANQINFHRKKNMHYYETVTKSINEKPFLWLARKLSGDNQLHFVEAPALRPPEIQFDEATMKKYEQELAAAAAMPLPEDDDEEDL